MSSRRRRALLLIVADVAVASGEVAVVATEEASVETVVAEAAMVVTAVAVVASVTSLREEAEVEAVPAALAQEPRSLTAPPTTHTRCRP
jgi:hypothetical protein